MQEGLYGQAFWQAVACERIPYWMPTSVEDDEHSMPLVRHGLHEAHFVRR